MLMFLRSLAYNVWLLFFLLTSVGCFGLQAACSYTLIKMTSFCFSVFVFTLLLPHFRFSY